ncbi:MAG: polysaccharide deacetylase [Flaviaesturariibacter sp.]|nr:polysaccharide deacetylase [Flaviaesturariibacter sp.]
MTQAPLIGLSFDVEEFDLPLEYGRVISVGEQLSAGFRGLRALRPLLDTASVRSTLFTTAFFALQYPEEIRALASRHEIGSHTYHHGRFADADLLRSRLTLEQVSGVPVTGLRMPRLKRVAPALVEAAGYQYDSSLNPTWVPGRYDHRALPRVPVRHGGIIEVPVSVTPRLRVPLFWLAFKNLPYSVYLRMALKTLETDGHLALYFHPWEFTDISAYRLPAYLRRGDGGALLHKLERLVKDLSGAGEFVGMAAIAARCQ